MVRLESHNVIGLKSLDGQINLETEDGLVLGIYSSQLDRDFCENFQGGEIQVAWGNCGDSHPVYLAIFYDDKRVYPI